MILAVMNAILAIAYIEALKSQDFNWKSQDVHNCKDHTLLNLIL